jgi:L-cysteine desulfidase
MEQQRIEVRSGGLQCDNPTCDWTDPTIQVEDYKQWLNAPCPKCGENVLTEEDLENTLLLRSLASLVNNIPEEHFEGFIKDLAEINSAKTDEDFKEKYNLPEDTERITMTFDVHKGIHIKDVKPADDGKE